MSTTTRKLKFGDPARVAGMKVIVMERTATGYYVAQWCRDDDYANGGFHEITMVDFDDVVPEAPAQGIAAASPTEGRDTAESPVPERDAPKDQPPHHNVN